MTPQEAVDALNGAEYTKEGSPELFAKMKDAGLVAVFGASDDLVELRGAIYDEIGAYEGTTFYVTPAGLLQNKCEDEHCPHFALEKDKAAKIKAVWCDENLNTSWSYDTDIPHETFSIYEEDELYCIGIVFALADASPTVATVTNSH
ncbi:hypothetical protein OIV19_21490 [Brucella sp. HL-2]|nr:hypothetical protein [Brucella sp. HL-2]MCV9910172.1 hypothetical protein [Brucella sp. HL-2]